MHWPLSLAAATQEITQTQVEPHVAGPATCFTCSYSPAAGAHPGTEASTSGPPLGPAPSVLAGIPLLLAAKTSGTTLNVSSTPGTAGGHVGNPSSGSTVPSTPLLAAPFKLACSFYPILTKLVHKIQALEFVEMRELLPDSTTLGECLQALPNQPHASKMPETREINSLPTWTSAFAPYVAVISTVHPTRVKDMLAYMHLIIHEAIKYGGSGWATYDQVFCRNHTGLEACWDSLDPSCALPLSMHRQIVRWPPVLCATKLTTPQTSVRSPQFNPQQWLPPPPLHPTTAPQDWNCLPAARQWKRPLEFQVPGSFQSHLSLLEQG